MSGITTTDFPKALWNDSPKNQWEFRFLRKCVRYKLGLRQTKPPIDGAHMTWKRAAHLCALAETFVR